MAIYRSTSRIINSTHLRDSARESARVAARHWRLAGGLGCFGEGEQLLWAKSAGAWYARAHQDYDFAEERLQLERKAAQ